MKKSVLLSTILSLSAVFFFSYDSSGSGNTTSVKATSIEFSPIDIPSTDFDHITYKLSDKLIVTYSDGSKKEYQLSFQPVVQSGDQIGNYKWGQLLDVNGQPMSNLTYSTGEISWNPDANSIIKTNDGKYFVLTHFEEPPGMIYAAEIDPNTLKAKSITPIDFSSVGGTIINCAGSLTPWNTHLGGEEDYSLNSIYSVSANGKNPSFVKCEKGTDGYFTGNDNNGKPNSFCQYVGSVQRYLKDTNINENNGYLGQKFNLYNYGYNVEVGYVNGQWKVAKHYVTGKYTPELAVVMPDKKTLYMSDDGSDKGLYKLVLDNPQNSFNENWCGTLYAAKVKQLSADNGGTFDVSWIELGKGCDKDIKTIIDKKPLLTDIFDLENPYSCPEKEGFVFIKEDNTEECLRLKTGKNRSYKFINDDEVKKAAAFLETRKYAAYLGATVEFEKGEGLAYDHDNNTLYFAVSSIREGMSDGIGDIKLKQNICGGVYELKLDKHYNAYKMKSILIGKEIYKDENNPDYNKYGKKYACHPDYIANPDNIHYLGKNILLIGEDSSYHLNNMLWAYDIKKKKLTRIGYIPTGAEITGLTDGYIGDKFVILINIQHPYVDIFKNADREPSNLKYIDQQKDKRKGIMGVLILE